MASNLTEASTWGATVSAPDDTDLASAASVRTPMTTIMNRTKWLVDSRSPLIFSPGPYKFPSSISTWDATPDGNGYIQQASVASARISQGLIPGLPSKGTITNLSCSLIGALGHAGLPATMPRLRLRKQATYGGADSNVADIFDSSASTAAYQVEHEISLTLTEAIVAGSVYTWRIDGEAGANSLVGLLVWRLQCTVTP